MYSSTSSVSIIVDGFCVQVCGLEQEPRLVNFVSAYPQAEADCEPQLRITAKVDGLHCDWYGDIATDSKIKSRPLSYHINIHKFTQQQHSFPAAKQGAFNQALGKKSKTILDATAGWGSDALLLCSQGYKLVLFERSPIMALMLDDAMYRLAQSRWAEENHVHIPQVFHTDTINFLRTEKLDVDCIYLDPMFPPKRKKSAAVNKYMLLLQWLVGEDEDAVPLVRAALDSGCKRVVVKRPNHAEALIANYSERFSSKLLHYDVYLQGA